MEAITIDRKLIPLLLQLPSHQLWIDYDAEGDVLYLSFEKPQQATNSQWGKTEMSTITEVSGWSA